MGFRFSSHAEEELMERGIPKAIVLSVLEDPEKVLPAKNGRSAYQSRVDINGKIYIVRIIVEPDGTVVTGYRTSKLEKYWSEE